MAKVKHPDDDKPTTVSAGLRVTPHAFERWHERWEAALSFEDTRDLLLAQIHTAEFVELDGEAMIYKLPVCGALLTVDVDGFVRTVLPRDAKKTIRRPKRWSFNDRK